jgi:hypothetical protein
MAATAATWVLKRDGYVAGAGVPKLADFDELYVRDKAHFRHAMARLEPLRS